MKSAPQPACLAVAKPLYSQVRELLLKRIGEGEWSTGEALPNEFVLSNNFGVSIGTIRRAIEGLEETGVLKRVQGRGTFVMGPGSSAFDAKFGHLRIAGRAATEIGYELVAVRRREADAREASELGLERRPEVIEIRQRVTLRREPVGVETSVVSAARFPRLETQFSYGQLVYRVLAEYGVLVTRSAEAMSIVAADADAAAELDVADGHDLLRVERVALTIDRERIEFRRGLYNLTRVAGLEYALALG